jgi:hypothetical protein
MRRLAILAAGAAFLSAASAQAAAVTFPSTIYGESVGSKFNLGAGDVVFAGNHASAGFAGTPFVRVGGDGPMATAAATAEWEFFVEGVPTSHTLVPILISGGYSLSTTGAGFVAANVLMDEHNVTTLSNLLHAECSSGVGDCSSTNFTIHTAVDAEAFQDLEIQTTGLGNGGGEFDGFLDPTISFDTSTRFDFTGLTLDVAPDALPVAGGGVPEPASWALMILGFGGVGAAVRRRRTRGLAQSPAV